MSNPIESLEKGNQLPVQIISNSTGNQSIQAEKDEVIGSNPSSTIISQKVLEQNEDILAAIVENLQLGRLNDCMEHYSVLHANLVALATELDNYPTDDIDAYDSLDAFPDEIMRRDLLDDFQQFENRNFPLPPIIPACMTCLKNNISPEKCRNELRHVEPSSKLCNQEQLEMVHASQVLLARQRQRQRQRNRHQSLTSDLSLSASKQQNLPENDSDDNGLPTNQGTSKSRRNYKRWSIDEKFTLKLAVAIHGLSWSKLATVFEDRTENQIRHFISKNRLAQEFQYLTLDDLFQNIPEGYQAPPRLQQLLASKLNNNCPLSTGIKTDTSCLTADGNFKTNKLVARQERNNFAPLLAIASGYQYTSTQTPVHQAQEALKVSDADLLKTLQHTQTNYSQSHGSFPPHDSSGQFSQSFNVPVNSQVINAPLPSIALAKGPYQLNPPPIPHDNMIDSNHISIQNPSLGHSQEFQQVYNMPIHSNQEANMQNHNQNIIQYGYYNNSQSYPVNAPPNGSLMIHPSTNTQSHLNPMNSTPINSTLSQASATTALSQSHQMPVHPSSTNRPPSKAPSFAKPGFKKLQQQAQTSSSNSIPMANLPQVPLFNQQSASFQQQQQQQQQHQGTQYPGFVSNPGLSNNSHNTIHNRIIGQSIPANPQINSQIVLNSVLSTANTSSTSSTSRKKTTPTNPNNASESNPPTEKPKSRSKPKSVSKTNATPLPSTSMPEMSQIFPGIPKGKPSSTIPPAASDQPLLMPSNHEDSRDSLLANGDCTLIPEFGNDFSFL